MNFLEIVALLQAIGIWVIAAILGFVLLVQGDENE